jgi:long-chain acyl-CoA synthetase
MSQEIPTLAHLFFHAIENHRLDPHLRSAFGDYSTERFARAVYVLNRYLHQCGLETGARVAILSENRPEWSVADFACQVGRYIVVPIYSTLSQSQIHYLLDHSACQVLIVSNQKNYDSIAALLPALHELRKVISLEELEGTICETSLPRLLAAGPERPDWTAIKEQAFHALPGDTATIVYTSGTTGTPKGVMLSHGNIIFDLDKSIDRLGQRAIEVRRALSVLPLSHVLERLLCYAYFRLGIQISYGDPHDLRQLLRDYHPQVMGCVPRILERIREAIDATIRKLPEWKQNISAGLIAAAVRCDKAEAAGVNPTLGESIKRGLARKIVYPKFHAQLGGIEHFVCGGAWLDPEVEHFFRAAGFTLVQGYGLTETSPVIALSPADVQRPGTVGLPLDGVEVKIGPDGEILVRGAMVMKGYYRDDVATEMTFDDGWLRTGDTGRFDEEGHLMITGRCKEILVLSTGKNISCALIEQALLRSEYIQTCFVVGDGQKFLSALIVPNLHVVERLAASCGLKFDDVDSLLTSPQVMKQFEAEIETQQASLAHYEQVKRFCYLREEALQDQELMTPTQKVRRNVLGRKFAPWIQQMMEHTAPMVIPYPPPLKTSEELARQGSGASH